MREILFRGKPKNEGDYYFFLQAWKDNCKDGFVYGSLVVNKNRDLGVRYYICVTALCSINSCVNNGVTSMIEVIPETIGQYTGLNDKKRKMLFEGDIVRVKRFKNTTIGKIIYNKKTSGLEFWYDAVVGAYGEKATFKSNLSLYEDIKVIGNVYDNFELIGSNRK